MPIKSIFQYSSIINYNFYFSEVFGNLKVPHNIYCDERIINYGIRNAKILLNSFEKKTNIQTNNIDGNNGNNDYRNVDK